MGIFYIAGVSVVFELVKAFTIEVFMVLKAEEKETKFAEEAKGKEEKNPLENLLDTFKEALGEDETLHVTTLQGYSSPDHLNTVLKKMAEEIEEEVDEFEESPDR